MSEVAVQRRLDMLRTALGAITEYLDCETITEIMLNPHGDVWVNEAGKGMYQTDIVLRQEAADRIIRLIATAAGVEINAKNPSLAAKLPHWGARVQASIPPYSVDGPTFNFRVPARKIYTLDDYLEQKRLSGQEVDRLRGALQNRVNIVIAGGTGSGKTTLINALLHELAMTSERIILIEDTLELQCKAANHVRKLVNPPELTLSKAIFDAMRENPDRIIVGEVRDQSAYDLINIWNTGHPGNICTVHASSEDDALHRLNRLAQQAQPHVDFMPELERMVGLVMFLN